VLSQAVKIYKFCRFSELLSNELAGYSFSFCMAFYFFVCLMFLPCFRYQKYWSDIHRASEANAFKAQVELLFVDIFA